MTATVNVLKNQTLVGCKKGLTNRADPDQTASSEAGQAFFRFQP